MEELGLAYKLEWYDRGQDGLAPPEYLALHPAATAPVIQDDGRFLTESAVIVEYICHRYADGRLTVAPGQTNYPDYLYWMHFNNNVQGLFFAKLALGDQNAAVPDRLRGVFKRREDRYFGYLDEQLAKSEFLAGPEFTCADIMVTFNLATLSKLGGRSLDDLPNASAYVERISKRPAYAKAMAIAGPNATRPLA